MKKLPFSLLAVLIGTLSLHAQEGARLGFNAGAVFANYKISFGGESEGGNTLISPTVGIVVDVPVAKNLCFQPAFNYVGKGTKDEESFGGNTEKYKLIVNAVEVPLNFLYNNTSNAGTLFVGAGPSIAFAISGKTTYDDGTDSDSEKINFGNSEDDDMKGLEVGANVVAGFRFPNGLFIAANYNAGLSNLIPEGTDDAKMKSHYFGIRLGWLLKGAGK